MADITEPRDVYVVWCRQQWPIRVFENPGHVSTAAQKLGEEVGGHNVHITRCKLVPIEELRVVRSKEYLEVTKQYEEQEQ